MNAPMQLNQRKEDDRMLTPEDLRNLILFLDRVDLKGAEVPAFLKVRNAVSALGMGECVVQLMQDFRMAQVKLGMLAELHPETEKAINEHMDRLRKTAPTKDGIMTKLQTSDDTELLSQVDAFIKAYNDAKAKVADVTAATAEEPKKDVPAGTPKGGPSQKLGRAVGAALKAVPSEPASETPAGPKPIV